MPTIELSARQRALIQGKMRQMHISQEALAGWIGLAQARLSQKLSGKQLFHREEVAAIADILDIRELIELYPETIAAEEREQRRLRIVMEVVDLNFQKLSPRDRHEVLFGLALLLEGKRPYGETPQSKMLRGLSRMVSDPEASHSRQEYDYSPERMYALA